MIEVQTALKLPTAEQLSAAFREARDKFLTEGGEQLRQAVERSIRTSGMTLRSGKIVAWQRLYRSKGYAAVRPISGETGANSPGAITNYLEGGHKIRGISGQAARYHPRIHVARVPGFRFYESARQDAQKIAADVAERISEAVAQKINNI
ncbi:MAG: hypothetical protein IKC50_05150 [Oscillospiraceae bacterium]|nr:hypothetical protein [Oscillospiraceae bacterium]